MIPATRPARVVSLVCTFEQAAVGVLPRCRGWRVSSPECRATGGLRHAGYHPCFVHGRHGSAYRLRAGWILYRLSLRPWSAIIRPPFGWAVAGSPPRGVRAPADVRSTWAFRAFDNTIFQNVGCCFLHSVVQSALFQASSPFQNPREDCEEHDCAEAHPHKHPDSGDREHASNEDPSHISLLYFLMFFLADLMK